jgi:hypothetical protein
MLVVEGFVRNFGVFRILRGKVESGQEFTFHLPLHSYALDWSTEGLFFSNMSQFDGIMG